MSLRKAMLAAVAVLLVLGGAGAAAWVATSGDEGASPLGGPSAANEPEQRTQSTPTLPESQPPADTTEAETETAPEETQPAPQPSEGGDARETQFPKEERGKSQNDPPQREFSIPPAREFSGTGNATLGNVNLRQSAVVKWRTRGRFELRFGREDFPIIAPSASGQLIVPPYNFKRVRVVAQGRWKISITPQD
jgi:hypothetical protein